MIGLHKIENNECSVITYSLFSQGTEQINYLQQSIGIGVKQDQGRWSKKKMLTAPVELNRVPGFNGKIEESESEEDESESQIKCSLVHNMLYQEDESSSMIRLTDTEELKNRIQRAKTEEYVNVGALAQIAKINLRKLIGRVRNMYLLPSNRKKVERE